MNEKLLAPHKGKLNGNLVKYCFADHLFTANLWNKIYNGSICRKAFSHLANLDLRKGEDWYTFLLLLITARPIQELKMYFTGII